MVHHRLILGAWLAETLGGIRKKIKNQTNDFNTIPYRWHL
jgi:hypothetical protein